MPRGIYVRTPEYRQKLRDAWYSSDKSRAHIKTLAEAAQTPEAKAKRSATLKKTLGTPEARRAKAEAATGRQVSDHTKEKIRRALTKLTPAQRLANKRVTRVFSNQLQRIMRKMNLRKSATAEQILGYTRAQLRQHLESQFRPGMSWESGGFHVDHIKPVAAFIREGVTDPAVIHALDNLQILTPHENLTKSDRYPFLQVPT
jgi:hypothetical protein